MTDEALRLELDRLAREIKSLKRELREKSKLWDTICSPSWMRLIWFLQGYRLWRVGRWYRKTKDLR